MMTANRTFDVTIYTYRKKPDNHICRDAFQVVGILKAHGIKFSTSSLYKMKGGDTRIFKESPRTVVMVVCDK